MINTIISLIIIIILWYIAFDCNKRLSQNLSKHASMVFTSIVYFGLMMIYMYYYIDDCREHLTTLNTELIFLLILVPVTTLVANLIFFHAKIPKYI